MRSRDIAYSKTSYAPSKISLCADCYVSTVSHVPGNGREFTVPSTFTLRTSMTHHIPHPASHHTSQLTAVLGADCAFGKGRGSWVENPHVWAVSFLRTSALGADCAFVGDIGSGPTSRAELVRII
jgi:hypothetical protein